MSNFQIDEALWVMVKPFCVYNLEFIVGADINTNATGNAIQIGIYKANQFSHEKIAYIIECFNAWPHYFDESMTWENFTFLVEQNVNEIIAGVNLYKYIFSTKANSDQNLARQNISQLALN